MKRILSIIISLVSLFSVANAQLLYKVVAPNIKAPSYLFGTHHLASLSILDSIPRAITVIDSVQRVCGEIDMISNSQMALAMKMQPFMMAPADSTIDKLLDPQKLADIGDKFEKRAGMKLELFYPMRPLVPQTLVLAAEAQKLTGRSATDPQLDIYFQQIADSLGKEVAGLETVEQQAELLYNGKSIAGQMKDLVKMLDSDEQLDILAQLTDAYMNQDLDRMVILSEKESGDDEDVEFMERLLRQRNANWLEVMPAMMADKPTLFVVGALHLAGHDGLVRALADRGFTVTPIQNETSDIKR